MKTCIIIPAFNESEFIVQTINSFISQTIAPSKVIIVDDNSSDNTYDICSQFSQKYSWIKVVQNISESKHEPGKKIVSAFNYGMKHCVMEEYVLIGKFDADIILPSNYFERMNEIFYSDQYIGMAGGNLYIKNNGIWQFENISEKTKVRGPIKLYRKECYQQIGGLKKSIGWDTVDELLAKYHGWKVVTDETLHVKHLKPTGKVYTKEARYQQGEAFYKMHYGFWLTFIASAKLASRKGNFRFFMDCMIGFFNAEKEKKSYIVSEKEGVFIRKLRWRNILQKIGIS